MNIYKTLIPSRSALVHMRFFFSVFLLPIFLFALSQAPQIITLNAILTFFIWHIFVYPASNGYNSYFDKDKGSIALVENPPQVDKSLYVFSLLLDLVAIILALVVSVELLIAVVLYGLFSKLYSHPLTRLKKYPVISFLIIFIFQGACVYWSSYAAISGLSISQGWNINFFLAGLICSCLIGATYPLTQVYQQKEDAERGDKTLSLFLGIRGSFIFSGLLFVLATLLLYMYWINLEMPLYFWYFLFFVIPVLALFLNWAVKVWRDEKEANFKNMSRMTFLSGFMMLLYFGMLNLLSH
ncbi:MAG: UbiA prenyltransferase family protein [Flavobacterium sp.]|nr:UbiA prenyltransferase family protein [Pedobacter sp.]